MRPEIAQRVLTLLYVAAVPATVYPLWRLVDVRNAVRQQQPAISFDSGVFYFFLMSIFFTFFIIQKVGAVNPRGKIIRNASKLVIAHFVCALALASSLAFVVPAWLERQGYSKCPLYDAHRVARGKRMLFLLGDCGSEVIRPEGQN